MKNILYKISKPHHKLKINIIDILLLGEVFLIDTPYYLLGRFCLILALILNYIAYYLLDDKLTKFEKSVIFSTMIIIGLLLIYLIITGK